MTPSQVKFWLKEVVVREVVALLYFYKTDSYIYSYRVTLRVPRHVDEISAEKIHEKSGKNPRKWEIKWFNTGISL